MFTPNTAETQFALEAVRQATSLVSQVQSEMIAPAMIKEDRSPVTMADYASQALVGYLLSQAFPNDDLVAEEQSRSLQEPAKYETLQRVVEFTGRFIAGATPRSVFRWIDRGSAPPSHRFWTLDPLDGTKGFLRGGQFVVALALIEAGQVQLGVLGCPELRDGYVPDPGGAGSLVIAMRGQGSWTTSLPEASHGPAFTRLQVSGRSQPAQARLLRSFEAGHTNEDQMDLLARHLGLQADPVLMDSQAKYAILAAGQGDLIVRLITPQQPGYREKIWDQAAGSLVVEEAGGRVTDLHGKPLDFSAGRTLAHNRGVLASNGLLHPVALQALAAIGA